MIKSKFLETLYTLITSIYSPHDHNICCALYLFNEDTEEKPRHVLVFEDPETKEPYKLTLERLEDYDIKHV